jgi:hypothetical protein
MRSRLLCREVRVLGKCLQQGRLWWRHFALGKRDAVEKTDYTFRDRAQIVQDRLVECDAPQRTTPCRILACEIALKNEPPLAQQDNAVDVPNALVGDRLIETGLEIGRKYSLRSETWARSDPAASAMPSSCSAKTAAAATTSCRRSKPCRTMIVTLRRPGRVTGSTLTSILDEGRAPRNAATLKGAGRPALGGTWRGIRRDQQVPGNCDSMGGTSHATVIKA